MTKVRLIFKTIKILMNKNSRSKFNFYNNKLRKNFKNSFPLSSKNSNKNNNKNKIFSNITEKYPHIKQKTTKILKGHKLFSVTEKENQIH